MMSWLATPYAGPPTGQGAFDQSRVEQAGAVEQPVEQQASSTTRCTASGDHAASYPSTQDWAAISSARYAVMPRGVTG